MIMSIRFISIFCCLMLCTCWYTSCKNGRQPPAVHSYLQIRGETMGTYYKITYKGSDAKLVQSRVDSLLADINSTVSVYEEDSFISIINKAPAGSKFDSLPDHFAANLERAFFWYSSSSGYMDPSVMPLINYWGFGYTPKRPVTKIDSVVIDSLNRFVGLSQWVFSENGLIKKFTQQQLDFGAIAKGYAVDQIASLLSEGGCQDFLIDIGGELRSHGLNNKGGAWVIGISTPKSQAPIEDVQLLIKLENKALASSGNYRNYYEVENRKYGHTIDPMTGYPYQDELLAVSIIADHCIDADAIATACMAMGYVKASTFIDQLTNVSACLLIGEDDGTIQIKYKNGFIQYVIESPGES